MHRLPTSVLAIALSCQMAAAHAVEEPAFTTLRQYEGFDLRTYPPVLVAEVTVAGPADSAANQGFRILAG